MITAAEVMPLLLDACPTFAEVWLTLQDDDLHVDDDGNRLNYLDASEFARYLVASYQNGAFGAVEAAFRVIERMHLEGDPYVRDPTDPD